MMFKNLFLTAAEAVTEAVTGAVTEAPAVTEVVTEAAEAGFQFEPLNFIANLSYMGIGMLAIFVVIAAIIGVVVALDVFVRAFSVKLPKNK